jgi:glutamine amidotransferase
MIALIDYGAGNLTSVRKALAHLGAPVTTPAAPADLAAAAGVIVPGVGNFEVTAALGDDWRAAIRDHIARERPMLGICVGMQWLFDGSAEAPGHPGLELLPGTCSLLVDEEGVAAGTGGAQGDRHAARTGGANAARAGDDRDTAGGGSAKTAGDPAAADGDTGAFKVPHVGWNSLHRTRDSWLLDGVDEGDQVYFTHSYAAPVTRSCVGSTRYGVEFAAAVEHGAVGGVQFHPEKSSDVGLRILGNFLRRVPRGS